MKRAGYGFFAVLLIMICCSWVMGDPSSPVKMQEDKSKVAIQGLAPKLSKDIAITGGRQSINISGDLGWRIRPDESGVFSVNTSATRTEI